MIFCAVVFNVIVAGLLAGVVIDVVGRLRERRPLPPVRRGVKGGADVFEFTPRSEARRAS